MLKKEINIINKVKIINLKKWLLVWKSIWPPSVEYIVTKLMKPSNRILINKIKSISLIFWNKLFFLFILLCKYIYIFKYLLLSKFFLISWRSIIFLNNFFAKGAATALPDPPCSIRILIAYLGFLYGPNAIYKAWSLSS